MRAVLLVGTSLLAGIASLASAQDEAPTGSRLGSRLRPGTMLSPVEAARGAMSMATCIDSKRPETVHAYLLSTDPKLSMTKAINVQADCLSLFVGVPMTNELSDTRKATIPDDILRGLLAEAELRRLRASVNRLTAAPLQPSYSRQWYAVTTRNVAVDELATCVAETNPGGLGALLATEAASQGEASAMAALSPNFGPCLRVGAKLQANRQSMRAALAEAMFQRLYAPVITAVPTPAATVGIKK